MTVDDFIKALGGPAKVSTALEVPLTTVHAWQRRGKVPSWRMAKLAEFALKEGKAVPAQFEAAA